MGGEVESEGNKNALEFFLLPVAHGLLVMELLREPPNSRLEAVFVWIIRTLSSVFLCQEALLLRKAMIKVNLP